MSKAVERITVSLPSELHAFVVQQKENAGHGNASLIVKEALRLLKAKRERHEKHLRAIRKSRRQPVAA